MEKPFSLKYLSVLIKNIIETRSRLKSRFSQMPFIKTSEIISSKADKKFLDNIDEIIHSNIDNPEFMTDDLALTNNISRSTLHKKLKAIWEKLAQGSWRLAGFCILPTAYCQLKKYRSLPGLSEVLRFLRLIPDHGAAFVFFLEIEIFIVHHHWQESEFANKIDRDTEQLHDAETVGVIHESFRGKFHVAVELCLR